MMMSVVWMMAAALAVANERDVSLAGEGWKFAKDPKGELRAEAPAFDDSKWESVRVPMNWALR